MNKPRVLFLCTGNSARSQMAEAFLRTYAGDRFEVHSAGVDAKGFILPDVIAVMKELGIAMEGQRSKSVTEYLGKMHFAHVVTVCGDAEKNCPAVFLNMGTHEHWPFDDPASIDGNDPERLNRTREIRDQIASRIREWLKTQAV
ncbi:MAG: low molecular weight phosphatase family protein [Anaerolineales bacterium]|nr:arsenate reductase ArsC [Anaerolineae bacterium]PWB71373.1 MAG: low molecular weight phosphatase family protein [Anaerolineales bacterium]